VFFRVFYALNRFFGLLFLAVFFMVLAFSMAAFASDTTPTSMDSLRVVIDAFGDFLKNSDVGSLKGKLVFMLIGAAAFRFIKEVLKHATVKWGVNGPSLVWKFIAIFFEQSILYYNAKLSGKEFYTAKAVMKQKAIEHILKHKLPVNIKTE
jgi:hypothetical protein